MLRVQDALSKGDERLVGLLDGFAPTYSCAVCQFSVNGLNGLEGFSNVYFRLDWRMEETLLKNRSYGVTDQQ
jgi:hypothetical protein